MMPSVINWCFFYSFSQNLPKDCKILPSRASMYRYCSFEAVAAIDVGHVIVSIDVDVDTSYS